MSLDTNPTDGRPAGTLTGVGLGPGDPELITVKGLKVLREAAVVFAPVRREGDPSYALTIAGGLIDADRQQVITLAFPEGSGGSWRERCRTIAEALSGGRRGVFLTEGDPSLFSTFGHVAATLGEVEPRLRVEVVPGVSSVTASAAAAGISLADYGERVAIVPAMHCRDGLEETLRSFETIVLVKVSPVLRETIALLDRLEILDRAVYIRRCGRPDQQVVRDLRALADEPPRDYFSLIIVRRTGVRP